MITSPDNDSSAIQNLTKVLDRDPSNHEAKMMIDKIIATYQDWAHKSLRNNDYNTARKHLLISQSLMEKLKNNTRQTMQKKLVRMLRTPLVTLSNKTIYTGNYRQKSYKPSTYSGATHYDYSSAARTNTQASASTYTLKEGDTVFEIMRQTGVYWKDIISINNLQPPYDDLPAVIKLK